MAELDISTTLDQLEERLERILFTLTGGSEVKQEAIRPRLHTCQQRLESVLSQHSAARELVQLAQTHAEIFAPRALHVCSTADQLSMVLASAPAYSETASRLATLQDCPMPSAAASTQLTSLQGRLRERMALQSQQMMEIAELRKRTAYVLERWYEIGILGTSTCWAEWETRLFDAERSIARRERRQRDEL